MPIWLLSALNNPAIRLLGVAALCLGLGYCKGKTDCETGYARKAAQEAAEWAEKVQASNEAAYERGLQAARRDAQRARDAGEIANEASKESGAGDVCLSAPIVERLRELRDHE